MNNKDIIRLFVQGLVVTKPRKNGVTSEQINSTLLTAALTGSFVNEACKSSGQVSKSQVIFRKIKPSELEEIQEYFREHTSTFLRLLKTFSRNRRFLVSFDETKEPFYGEEVKDLLYLHSGSIAKGSNCFYEFLSVAITCNSLRYVLDAVIFPRGGYKADYVEKLTTFVKGLLPLEVVLFDRGFTDWEIIDKLKKLRVPYIIFWQKSGEWHKQHFDGLEDGDFACVNRKYTYYRNRTSHHVSSNFVIVKQLEYDGKKFDWIFATNIKLKSAKGYVKRYKKRWGIETIYRVTDNLRIRTTSVDPLIRYFLFAFTCLVYNVWKWVQNHIGEEFTLANFKANLTLFLAKRGLLYPKHFDIFEVLLSAQKA